MELFFGCVATLAVIVGAMVKVADVFPSEWRMFVRFFIGPAQWLSAFGLGFTAALIAFEHGVLMNLYVLVPIFAAALFSLTVLIAQAVGAYTTRRRENGAASD